MWLLLYRVATTSTVIIMSIEQRVKAKESIVCQEKKSMRSCGQGEWQVSAEKRQGSSKRNLVLCFWDNRKRGISGIGLSPPITSSKIQSFSSFGKTALRELQRPCSHKASLRNLSTYHPAPCRLRSLLPLTLVDSLGIARIMLILQSY